MDAWSGLYNGTVMPYLRIQISIKFLPYSSTDSTVLNYNIYLGAFIGEQIGKHSPHQVMEI